MFYIAITQTNNNDYKRKQVNRIILFLSSLGFVIDSVYSRHILKFVTAIQLRIIFPSEFYVYKIKFYRISACM